jgi:hypothetical protein
MSMKNGPNLYRELTSSSELRGRTHLRSNIRYGSRRDLSHAMDSGVAGASRFRFLINGTRRCKDVLECLPA